LAPARRVRHAIFFPFGKRPIVSLTPLAPDFADLQLPPPPTSVWRARDDKPGQPGDALRLAETLRTPPLAARVLTARGLADPEDAERFLRPMLSQLNDPMTMKGIPEAVKRLGRALDAGEVIWIFADYDVDGVTAMVVLRQALLALGGRVEYYIPHRLNEGYGLSVEGLEELHERGARLIVTVDCGVTAVDEALRARELGIDLIVTDHHQPGPELPAVAALIDPLQPGCAYPFKKLAGVGVAFKLAHALLKARHPDPAAAKELLKSMLDLVALGTVADIVPLSGENRALVTAGLGLMRKGGRLGLRSLCRRAGIKPALLDASHVSFVLGPRLNAAGRTEHANFSAELLLADDEREAARLAEQLEAFNDNRRAIEQEMLGEAVGMIAEHAGDKVLVIAREGWHPGVLGIVAARVVGLTHRPTLIVGIDGAVAKGSGRSIPGFDLVAALGAVSGCLERHGGHKMAAGMTLAADRVDELRVAINAHADAIFGDALPAPVVEIDAEARAEELTVEAARALEAMAPYGPDNPKPVLAVGDLRLVDDPIVLKDRHLKLRVAGPNGRILTALGWNMAHRRAELDGYRGSIRLAGTPTINAWNGRADVELTLKDFQI
jgi:single-stranded-DNA-specific exonuclease